MISRTVLWLLLLIGPMAIVPPATAGARGLLGVSAARTGAPLPHWANNLVTTRASSGSIDLIVRTSAAAIHDPGSFLYAAEVRLRDGQRTRERISGVAYTFTSFADFQPRKLDETGLTLSGRAHDGFRLAAEVTLIRTAGGGSERVVRLETSVTSWSPR